MRGECTHAHPWLSGTFDEVHTSASLSYGRGSFCTAQVMGNVVVLGSAAMLAYGIWREGSGALRAASQMAQHCSGLLRHWCARMSPFLNFCLSMLIATKLVDTSTLAWGARGLSAAAEWRSTDPACCDAGAHRHHSCPAPCFRTSAPAWGARVPLQPPFIQAHHCSWLLPPMAAALPMQTIVIFLKPLCMWQSDLTGAGQVNKEGRCDVSRMQQRQCDDTGVCPCGAGRREAVWLTPGSRQGLNRRWFVADPSADIRTRLRGW